MLLNFRYLQSLEDSFQSFFLVEAHVCVAVSIFNAASAPAPDLSSAAQDSTDWLNTPESVAMQIAAQQFATAFFTQDVEGTQALLFWGQPAEPYPEPITLSYTVLKWHPEDLAAGGEIEVSLQFQSEGSDTAQYLTLTLLKADGWQVTGYALEG